MDRYQTTFNTYNKVASAYQDKFMEMDLYNGSYDRFCELISKPNAGVFEIGCGPGNITRYLLSKRPDFNIEAIDMAPNMIALAQQNNPSATFSMKDCRNIDLIKKKFDGIICGFCIPYLSKEDCRKLIRDSAALLNNDGVIYLSAIEGDYSKSGFETSNGNTVYIYYHESAYLLETLDFNGFRSDEPHRISYKKSDGTDETHIIFIAVKNEIS